MHGLYGSPCIVIFSRVLFLTIDEVTHESVFQVLSHLVQGSSFVIDAKK